MIKGVGTLDYFDMPCVRKNPRAFHYFFYCNTENFSITKIFGKLGVHGQFSFEFESLSTNWLKDFLGVHQTPLNSDKCLPAAFQTSLSKMWGIFRPIESEEFHRCL